MATTALMKGEPYAAFLNDANAEIRFTCLINNLICARVMLVVGGVALRSHNHHWNFFDIQLIILGFQTNLTTII